MTKKTWATVAIIVIVGVALVWVSKEYGSSLTALVSTKPSLASLSTVGAPWPPELNHLRERLAAIGLPALAQEGTVLHIHQHLDLYIEGVPVPVPADIGINQAQGFISPIHVHDTTGIIHVESQTVQTFTLGQFFDVWGVTLTPECIGGYCATEGNSLNVYVNGQKYQGDPTQLPLTSHEEIVITYGTQAQLPTTIPSSYSFPEGY